MLSAFLKSVSHAGRDETGATAVEYGIMVALIAVVIIAAVTLWAARSGRRFPRSSVPSAAKPGRLLPPQAVPAAAPRSRTVKCPGGISGHTKQFPSGGGIQAAATLLDSNYPSLGGPDHAEGFRARCGGC
jgi:Flp pilus assembly pilin Flp